MICRSTGASSPAGAVAGGFVIARDPEDRQQAFGDRGVYEDDVSEFGRFAPQP